MTKQQDMAKKQFLAQFVTLVQDSLYQAITTGKIQQIYFDINNKLIIAKTQNLSLDTDNKHKKFKPLSKNDSSTQVNIPEHLFIRNFFIQDKDEFTTDRNVNDVWFYIMPDGTSQSIIINFEYSDPESQDIDQFALSVNPFYSQVYQYDTFQKP